MPRVRNKKEIPWIVFEDFKGFQTKYHKSHKNARGYLVGNSKNCIVNEEGAIIPRLGYTLFGEFTATATAIKTMMKFVPRTGNDILLRTTGTLIEYYSVHSSAWETLLSGLTTGLVFGWRQMDFTDDTGTTPANFSFENILFFGNGTDVSRGWNGATAKLASTTATTITIDGSTAVTALEPPFRTTGGGNLSLIINGTVYTYTGNTGNRFDGVSPSPVGEAVGSSIAQITIDETAGGSTQPNISIYHKTDNARLVGAGVTSAQGGIYVSKTNNPRNFTFSNPRVATDGAVINVTNAVKALEQLQDKIYYLCPDLIGWLRFTQIAEYSGGYDLIEIRPEIVGYDVGPQSSLATAKWDNKVLYASRNGIRDLGTVVNHATNQVDVIHELLKPTFDVLDLSTAALVVYKNKLYVACRKTTASTFNDIVYVYDILERQWETPLTLSVGCWLIANGNLYFGSSINTNTYQLEVANQHSDDDNNGTSAVSYPINPVAELWQENFGLPFIRKTLYGMFLEGEIATGEEIKGKIYLDEAGYSGTLNFTITGTQSGIIFTSSNLNTFSLQSFAIKMFAGDDDAESLKFFRVNFEPRSISHFYVVSLELSSTKLGSDFKIKRVGWKVDQWNREDTGIKIAS